jgi:serine/threonine protein phosphatase PrpC
MASMRLQGQEVADLWRYSRNPFNHFECALLRHENPHRHFGQGSSFDPERTSARYEEGDVMCPVTDGLPKGIAQREVEAVLRDFDEPQRAANELVTRAYDLGSRDYITALVVE